MKVHIFTKQNNVGFIEDLKTSDEVINFAESLPERFANEDFDAAIILDNGDVNQFVNLHKLISWLNGSKQDSE